jgi:protein ImuB
VPERRVVAIVLTDLACQLAFERQPAWAARPLAVVLSEGEGASRDEGDPDPVSGAGVVFAVNALARGRGVRPGMMVSAAMARTADLVFASVGARAIHSALGVVAEVALEFGATVEVAAWDTVWVDVTGGAHLFGGEERLSTELAQRIGTLGWSAEVAISDGPELARALARFGEPGALRRAAPGQARAAIQRLPVAALPVDVDAASFFARLGVLTLGDLMRIDRAQLVGRLDALLAPLRARDPRAPDAKTVLGWLDGRDARPLVPYVPPAILTEQVAFEDGVETAGQLVFAVRGAVSRLSARLTGRRQAAGRLDLLLHYDRPIFRLRRADVPGTHADAASLSAEPWCALGVELPSPLCHTDDLFRAVKAKLEGLELAAPVVRIELALTRIDRAPEVQLDLSRDVSVDPDALPALLSELSAEIGAERVGVLVTHDDHRPELRTRLEGAVTSSVSSRSASRRKRGGRPQLEMFGRTPLEPGEPTRLLGEPVALGCSIGGDGRLPALRPGATILVGRDAFVVESIRFDRRMDGIAWWSACGASRDYLRVTLLGETASGKGRVERGGTVVRGPWGSSVKPGAESSGGGARQDAAEAWVYVDRRTGEVFLQGWWE